MIRVVVVDDHPIVREGLVAVLGDETDLCIVGAAASAEAALAIAERERPDVLLLDLELPGMDGAAAIPRLAAVSPATRVVVFTAYGTDDRVLGALRAGAKGYLLKGAPAAEIVRSIRVVHAGGAFLEGPIAAKVLSSVTGSATDGAAAQSRRHGVRRSTDLSERERSVLRLVAGGLSTKQMARALGITERTVKFHVTSIFNKLGADNRAQAVALAAGRGLLR